MSVDSGLAKSMFKAHTAMTWNTFEKEVSKYLNGAVLPLQLAYRLSGDAGKMLYLKEDTDWQSVLGRLDAKIPLARKNAVSMEVRNLVGHITVLTRRDLDFEQTKQPKAPNAKDKRKRDNDTPPPPNKEVESQYAAYRRLEATIKCEAHDGHCLVERSGGRDNHRRLNYQEMTLWAQQMVRAWKI